MALWKGGNKSGFCIWVSLWRRVEDAKPWYVLSQRGTGDPTTKGEYRKLSKYKKGRQRLAVCLVQDHGRNENTRAVSVYQMRTRSRAFISVSG